MGLRARLNLPREHGAWAMFYVPMALGLMAAGTFNWRVVLTIVSSSLLFISRESLLQFWRARERGRHDTHALGLLTAYGMVATILAAILLWYGHLYLLPALAVPGLILLMLNGHQAAQRQDRSIATELLAICGMTLSAPAIHYAALGRWDGHAWWLWAFSILYFASSVFYVKYRVSSLHGKNEAIRQRNVALLLLYHGGLLIGLSLLVVRTTWPVSILAGYLPVIFRAFHHYLHPPAELNLKRIGMLEILYAAIFLTCLSIGTFF